MGEYAWVTLATNDAYSLGALVLAHSLRQVGTKYDMAVLITPGVTETMREKLSAVFSVVMEVNVLDSKDEANLALLARPELGVTFTKLHCWRLTQYEKCVFLDADTLVVRNCDELFEREELSAAPDVGWPDCFNSGVFVYRPCQQTFASITAFAAAKGSFDGGDQGLLNMYFSDWARKDISKHLPFIYNMCSTAAYSYLPAFKQFGDDVRIIHFIGITKPWLQYFDTLTGIVQPPMDSAHLQPLLQLWWNIFCEKVHPQLSPVMATSTLAPIWHKFSPMPYESRAPKTSIYTDIQDKTQNDTYLGPPDFSEFQDPWENYSVQNDPAIYKTEDNETQQYYSTVNNSQPTSILSEQFSCPKSVHQTHYESPPDHSRDVYHRQQHNECNSSSRNQPQHHHHHHHHHHPQEQYNQLINQNAPQQSSSYSKDTSISEVQPSHWQNQHSIENSISVQSVQSHHSDESQHHHVDYQCVPRDHCYDNSRLVLEKTNQYQQVDHQYNYQHSFNDSNKSQSVEIKESQRNEPHGDHQCNHYQVYDHVNNEQVPQHYEQKNQMFHTNSQTDFRREEQKPFDEKVDHDQGTKNSIVYRNDPLIQRNTEQIRNITITDERTDTLVSTSPYPDSKPCTDFHNVASQSDPQIGDDLNSSNAGLAGALAQMTLGEPRSPDQIALEEHMRKQSWEQGHIDYMGRDSFDNIWKKICETLALAPPRLPSPPKEIEKPEETDTDKTDVSTMPSEAAQSIESIDEVDKVTAETTTSHIEEQYLVNNVPITNVPKLLEKNEEVIDAKSSVKESKDTITQELSTESRNETTLDTSVDSFHSNVSTSHKEVAELSSSSLSKEAPEQAIASAVGSDSIHPHSIEEEKAIALIEEVENITMNVEALETIVDIQETKQPDIRDEEHAKEELSAASEILTVSPVPIQVAESVLQVEPKESMSDSQITPHEILPSTITAVDLIETETKVDINRSTSSNGVGTVDKLNELPKKSLEASQIALPVEQAEPQLTVISQTLEIKSEETEVCLREAIESTPEATPECEETKASLSTETPVRPSRAKELGPASTSCPKATQEEQSPEAAIKKTVKKSAEKPASEESTETTDGDSIGKKVTKKVVKKVIKKPKTKSEEGLDDGAEDSSSTIKQKKTGKVVKKGAKSLQTPATDPAVPETPSSSTSDAPVPPKRKTKATAAKTVTKKSDIKQ